MTDSNVLPEQTFNILIDSFIENRIGVADNFLSESLSLHLKENLRTLYKERLLKVAGVGNNAIVMRNNLFRSDIIYWLDRSHNDVHEDMFFVLMDRFVSFLNKTCFTAITSYEFHYTLYEEGSFYKKHIDQFKSNDSRQYSMIMYLNADWKQDDGGELRIHHEDRIENISPVSGKTVFFKSSELEHEVLVSHKQRMSITGWLKS